MTNAVTTRVLNIADRPPTWPRTGVDVYVGRNPEFALACGMTFPVWGNPFRVPTQGTREACIAQYEVWTYRRLTLKRADVTMLFLVGADLRNALAALDGKALWCHCSPKPCHGTVLAKLAAEIKAGTL